MAASRLPQPALTGAGAAVVGAALGGVVGGRAGLEIAALLGVLGVWMLHAGAPKGVSLWMAAGILLLTAWQSGVAGANGTANQGDQADRASRVDRASQADRVGRVHRATRWRARGPGLDGYYLAGEGAPARLALPKGSVRESERVWVAPWVGTREWARSTVRRSKAEAAGARALPLRPAADQWVRLGPADSSRAGPLGWRPLGWIRGAFERVRQAGVARMEGRADPPTGGLLCALLFGETVNLPPGFADLFTRTGTRHLLALSGLHVGLIAWILGRPLAALIASLAGAMAGVVGLRWRPGPAVPLALLAVAFVPIAGFGAPATRAALGLSVAALACLARPGTGGRRPSGLNILGLALMVELLVEPTAPFEAGVQLSYGATAALILVAPRGARRLASMLPFQGDIHPTAKSGRRRPPSARALWVRAVQACSLGASASVIASFATLPIVWTRFGEWSPVGILATPVALPLVFLLVAFGWLSLIAPPWITDPPLQWTTSALLSVLSLADHAPWSPLPLPVRPLSLLAGASIAGLMAMVARGGQESREGGASQAGLRWARASAAAFAIALVPWPGARAPQAGGHDGPRGRGPISPTAITLEVHVLDVGDGTAIVARAPGSRTLLFDAGSRDRIGVGTRGVAPLLRAIEASTIDIILSHNHADHYRALPWLARRWPADRWLGELPPSGEDASFHVPFAAAAEHKTLSHGSMPLDFGGGLHGFLVRGGPFQGNEGSFVLDLRWNPGASAARRSQEKQESRVILSGDAEGHGLAAMLRGQGHAPWLKPGPVDALLLPHHGSSSRHLGWLLDHLQPKEVWISSSADPRSGIRKECAQRGIRLRATATDGPILWRATDP